MLSEDVGFACKEQSERSTARWKMPRRNHRADCDHVVDDANCFAVGDAPISPGLCSACARLAGALSLHLLTCPAGTLR